MFLGNKDKAIATRVYICNNRRMMESYWSNWNRHKKGGQAGTLPRL
jgi:hypothetical protein